LPSFISILMLPVIVFWDFPFLIGIWISFG
jgi:hypothetical protein